MAAADRGHCFSVGPLLNGGTARSHGSPDVCCVSQLTHSTIDVLSDHERGARYERQDRIAFDVLVVDGEHVDMAV